MNEEKTFENRPVTMNPKKNLLEIEEHMYILDDVEKPNVFRDRKSTRLNSSHAR